MEIYGRRTSATMVTVGENMVDILSPAAPM